MTEISLTSSSRTALLSLQQTSMLSERTQNRLATGRKVSSAVEDAVSFFQAKSLTDRASDFTGRKAQIDQGVSSLSAAVDATASIDKLLKQLKGIATSARGATAAERASATENFKEIGKQIAQLVKDASYQGLNLLTSTSAQLKVEFSERSASQLKVDGFGLIATAGGNKRALFTGAAAAFSRNGAIVMSSIFSITGGFSRMDMAASTAADANSAANAFTKGLKRLDNAISQLRGITARLGTNVTILQTRSDFSQQYLNTLQQGSDKLTLADLNTEAANMTALQTRQQLGIQSLSFASQQQQAILGLLR